MKSYLDNLRPFERRLVVGIATVVFIVLNFAFVFPHFSDWGHVKDRLAVAQKTLAKFQDEISHTNTIDKLVNSLESEGSVVPAEEQAAEFSRAVNLQAGESHVGINNFGKMSDHITQFFIEKSQPLTLASTEDELVDFLYKLGAGNSLIRVRGLAVRPDPKRETLSTTVTLVASFQKKTPVRPTAHAPATPAPASAAAPRPAPPGPTATAKAK
jgi:hypothetical protein